MAARRTLKTGETVGGFVLPGIRFAVIGCAMRNKGLRHRITLITGDAVGGRTTRRLRRVPAGQPHPPLFVRRARLAAQPGSALLRDLVHRCWADFWTNPAHTEPPHAELMAGEFAVHLRNGDVYSVEATICPCPLSAKQSAEMTTMRFEADQGNSAWSLCASIPDLATHAQKHKEK